MRVVCRLIGDRQATVFGDDRRERVAIDVVDLARGERHAGLDDFVARRENRDRWLGKRLDLDQPESREGPDATGVERTTGGQNGLTAGDVGTLPSDILAWVDGREDAHVGAAPFGFLDHHDGVGTLRHWCAGRDLGGLAGAHSCRRYLARVDLADHAKRLGVVPAGAERVLGNHRIAVHRRACEGRHVTIRDDVCRQHAAVRVHERHALCSAQARDGAVDQRARFVERNGVTNRTHGLGHVPFLRQTRTVKSNTKDSSSVFLCPLRPCPDSSSLTSCSSCPSCCTSASRGP